MADQTITPVQVALNAGTTIASASWASLTSSNDGVLVPPPDARFLILARDSAGGATLTIKAGDGLAGSQGDIVISNMTQNLIYCVVAESARVKNTSGADTGKIRIKASAAVSVACVELP
ncbi:hypothetical protein [Thermogutta sp.]|uniref:hypothetical protein n=1 Tax=Thermogutta sp. TaxID=1962930 RepID=UPI0032200634